MIKKLFSRVPPINESLGGSRLEVTTLYLQKTKLGIGTLYLALVGKRYWLSGCCTRFFLLHGLSHLGAQTAQNMPN